ncbi:MAG: hypothetical protein A3K66_00840 [Euryarchaeota archaeon RBG_16_67_27]|nr:MAG: hypothetical protein A3K66_00840 [Euryarchaeota archaeon RBG_16_67_27]
MDVTGGRVVGDILNFNPDRGRSFDPSRGRTFDSQRPLEFDSGRNLEFNQNRDLGFGHRGVVFRGYVCPICGAIVTEDTRQCGECGTVFEVEPRAAKPTAPALESPTLRRPEAKAPPAVPPPGTSPRGSAYCAYCGVKLHAGDTFCWNCGTRVAGTKEVVRLPPQKDERVTREWK